MPENTDINDAGMTLSRALRVAPHHELDSAIVYPYIFSGNEKLGLAEEQFQHAYDNHVLPPPPRRSPYLNGVIGKVAEDVTSILFVECHDWLLIGQDADSYPGSHGVDILLLSPTDKLYAVEVKGTFSKSRWPRLSKGKTKQMTLEWLSKSDNPILADWDLHADEIYGMIIYIHFGKGKIKGAITSDFMHGKPICSFDDNL